MTDNVHFWKSGKKRWFLRFFMLTFSFEIGRVRGVRWANVGYGGQEKFGTVSAGFGWGFWFSVDTPFKWHRIRPRDGKYGEAHCEFGLNWSNGRVRLELGHDPMGTWYGGGKGARWRRALRQTWKNRELILWDSTWLMGRRKTNWVGMAEIPWTLNVGQWEGDSYTGTMNLRRLEWQTRFRKGARLDWEFAMPSPGRGIPIPGNPDSDFFDGDDAIFGFGESADDLSLTEATARLEQRVRDDRAKAGFNWRPEPASVSAGGER